MRIIYLDCSTGVSGDMLLASLSHALEELEGPGKGFDALEAELAGLPPEERAEFREELGLEGEGADLVIRAAYQVLGLITFYSANEKQATAWPIPRETTAPRAAGAIHSDFERGFIRAETIAFETFVEMGSLKAARDQGLIRSEGKDYIVADGDVILFRFNV